MTHGAIGSPISDPGIGSESDFRSRDCEFDGAQSHTFVKIDLEIFSTVILLLPLIQERLVSVTSKCIWAKYWLTA